MLWKLNSRTINLLRACHLTRNSCRGTVLPMVALLPILAVPLSWGQEAEPAAGAPHPLYLRLRLDNPVKAKNLKPGDVLPGKLGLDVYSGNQQIFAAGSPVQLTVDQLATRRRVPNDHWPWVIKFFTPRHEKYPVFKSATVVAPDGSRSALPVETISIGERVEVGPKRKQNQKEPQSPAAAPRRKLGPTVVLAAERGPANGVPELATRGNSSAVTLPPGTPARVVLLGGVSAGKSRAGEAFSARLIEPIRVNSEVVIPEGAVFHGRVAKSSPPKMLSRPGSLFLSFTSVEIPGKAQPLRVEAVVTQIQRDDHSHTTLDPEGDMHGGNPGKAWLLANIGVTAGFAKVADDGAQLLIEAVVSTATDASTAGTGKIVAACVSGVFLLTRHGRDVVLPRYDEMEIMLSRSATLPAGH
ncbi:MAG: hypothetical protein H0X25_04260 [Acidobacteriales bacterium]|nr:hypothetical protein [Terriglobales bacterium]